MMRSYCPMALFAALAAAAAGCTKSMDPVERAGPPAEVAAVSAREEPVVDAGKTVQEAPEGKSAAADPTQVARLVEDLGHEEFERREAASRALAKIGEPALGALKEAAKRDDPEVQRRAEELVAAIESRGKEAKAPTMPATAHGLRGVQMHFQVGGEGQPQAGAINFRSVRTVATEEGTATIAESNEGLSLTLQPKQGEPQTFVAPSREEFKRQFPKVYAQYIEPTE